MFNPGTIFLRKRAVLESIVQGEAGKNLETNLLILGRRICRQKNFQPRTKKPYAPIESFSTSK